MGKFTDKMRERMRRKRHLKRIDVTDIVRPAWDELLDEGQRVYLREDRSEERDLYQTSRVKTRFLPNGKTAHELTLQNLRARRLAPLLIDEDWEPLFDDDGAELLAEESGALMDRLWEADQKLSGLDKDAEEELEKNSSRANGDGLHTSSPSPAGNGTLTVCSPA